MAALKVYNGASWDLAIAKVYDGAAWKDQMQFYDGSAFVELYPTLDVTVAPTKAISRTRTSGTPAYAGVQVNNDGDLYASSATGSYTGGFYETWLDAGLNTEVWVERVIISGSLNSQDPGAGLLTCATTRNYRISTTGLATCVIDLKFYDAASLGQLLDTQRVTLTADLDIE